MLSGGQWALVVFYWLPVNYRLPLEIEGVKGNLPLRSNSDRTLYYVLRLALTLIQLNGHHQTEHQRTNT